MLFQKTQELEEEKVRLNCDVDLRYLLVSNTAHAALIALFKIQQKIDIDVSAFIYFHCTMCPSSSVTALKLFLFAHYCQGWEDVENAITQGEKFNPTLIELKRDEVLYISLLASIFP